MHNALKYISFAPIQGYTDHVYRQAHCQCAGGVDEYYTPFVRMEKGAPRRHDMADTGAEANSGVPTVPQVIAANADEFARLCDALQAQGWNRIDLNMGCPFPMQVRSGRGSGLLAHPDCVEAIACEMKHRPEVVFSVKMRLGLHSPDEARALMPILNSIALLHITIHPRLGIQQYRGVPDMQAFESLMSVCSHPVVYNGDLHTTEAMVAMQARYPLLKGFMLGRGLLARPWMLSEKSPGSVVKGMHERVYRHAVATYCGEKQTLMHLQTFWEYMASWLDHRQYKAIVKSRTLQQYNEAVVQIIKSL